MQYKIIIFIISLFFSSMLFAQERSLDRVVAVVNSNVITNSELNQQIIIARNQMRSAGSSIPSDSKLREIVLNRLIDNLLQLDIARKAKLTVSDTQVNTAIAKIAAQNNISIDQLRKGVESEGMSFTAYRRQIKEQILLSEVQQHFVAPKVKISEQDVKNSKMVMPQARINSNAQYHVVDIVGSQDLLEKLNSSNDPDEFLKNNSSLTVNDLGFRTLSQLPDIFVKPVQSLKPGEFSHTVQAPNGIHILKLVEVRGGQTYKTPALTQQQIAYQNKYNEALKNWLQTLRSQSYVKIND